MEYTQEDIIRELDTIDKHIAFYEFLQPFVLEAMKEGFRKKDKWIPSDYTLEYDIESTYSMQSKTFEFLQYKFNSVSPSGDQITLYYVTPKTKQISGGGFLDEDALPPVETLYANYIRMRNINAFKAEVERIDNGE